MIGYKEAYRLIFEHSRPLGIIEIETSQALGTTLAEDIPSDINIPPFDKSTMDGFAVGVDTGREILKIIGEARAGEHFSGRIEPNEAVRIMTGARVPEGADAVVMQEEATELEDNFTKINTPVKAGQNITRMASDLKHGEVVLKKGQLIRGAEISILATVGRTRVRVYRKPKVTILATGNELVDPNQIPASDQIRESSTPALAAMLKDSGFDVINLGIITDEEDHLKNAFQQGLEGDTLIICGGVSVGKYDLVPNVLSTLGVEKIFHKVKIKPGKPFYFGKLGDKTIFGLPGNPISTFLTFKLFVEPSLKKMSGMNLNNLEVMRGISTKPITPDSERLLFIPVSTSHRNGGRFLEPIEFHHSANILAITKSDAFAMIESGSNILEPGTPLEFFKW